MKLIALTLIFFFTACSVYKTRRSVKKSEVIIRNGVYSDKEWSSDLVFKRYSWFKDATMSNEILLSRITMSSDFVNWLGSDRVHISSCESFYIGLIYSDNQVKQGNPYLLAQLNEQGVEEKSIIDFSYELKAHQNFKDWNLSEHKIIGLCQTKKNSESLTLTLPGFKKSSLN
jgi:hypothetical protein